MTIIKIVSFPFRLVLFVIIALLTSVIWGFNHTVVTFFQVGSAIVSAIGKVFSAMTLGGVIIQAVWELIDNGKIDSLKNTIILLLLIIGLEVFFQFLPVIFQALSIAFTFATMWLWAFSKMILFCHADELNYV